MKSLILGILIICNYSLGQSSLYSGSKVSVYDAQEFIKQHNIARSEVGVPEISWNTKLAKVAQRYADFLASNGCFLKHSENSDYGENLFMGDGAIYTALDASNAWYEEKKQYWYSKINYSNYMRIGHYTQMIWKNTSDVGLGVARCSNGSYIYVANYFPAGNYIGQYPY